MCYAATARRNIRQYVVSPVRKPLAYLIVIGEGHDSCTDTQDHAWVDLTMRVCVRVTGTLNTLGWVKVR